MGWAPGAAPGKSGGGGGGHGALLDSIQNFKAGGGHLRSVSDKEERPVRVNSSAAAEGGDLASALADAIIKKFHPTRDHSSDSERDDDEDDDEWD